MRLDQTTRRSVHEQTALHVFLSQLPLPRQIFQQKWQIHTSLAHAGRTCSLRRYVWYIRFPVRRNQQRIGNDLKITRHWMLHLTSAGTRTTEKPARVSELSSPLTSDVAFYLTSAHRSKASGHVDRELGQRMHHPETGRRVRVPRQHAFRVAERRRVAA